jgi:hypothetical protein
MEAHAAELRASKRKTLRGALSTAPVLPASEFAHHVGIYLIERSVGVTRPEIVPPAGRISPPGWSLLPSAPARTRAGLSPARTARLNRTHHVTDRRIVSALKLQQFAALAEFATHTLKQFSRLRNFCGPPWKKSDNHER